ncbi:MAG: hypothetical protein DWI24_05010 [Planctomycetota bacterium]|nr:MAG: hypothetical protein DWI24_05010 [Planctomycetota bacterium]
MDGFPLQLAVQITERFSPMSCLKFALLVLLFAGTFAISGCGGSSAPTPAPEIPKVAPDPSEGALSNPFNPAPAKKKAK